MTGTAGSSSRSGTAASPRSKEVSLVGSGSHFEIWSSAVLASKEEEERKLLDGYDWSADENLKSFSF